MVSKDIRIAIIGAGPGGLTAAETLKEKGYQNITIFEKHNHVGGQALSEVYKTPDAELVYELGSLQPMSTGMGIMHQLMKRYHMHMGKNSFAHKKVLVKIYDSTDRQVKIDFTKSPIGYPITFRNMKLLFQDVIKLLPFIYRYRKLAGDGYTSLNEQQTQELSVPFEEWVDQQHFKLIDRELKFVLGSMLTFANPNYKQKFPLIKFFKLLMQCLKFPPRYINGTIQQMQEGYQELWRRVALKHDVKLNTPVKFVHRNSGGIVIELESGELLHFDKLIIACTPLEAEKFLQSPTEAEKNITQKMRYSSGWRVAFLAKHFPKDAAYGFYEPYFSGDYPSRIQVIVPEGKVDDEVWLYTGVLSYDKKTDIDVQLKEVEKFLHEHFQAEVVKWLHTVYWTYYTPYFYSEDVKDNIYKKFESLQGENNTYYIGALLSGGTHAIVASYAHKIIDHYFQ